MKIRVSLIVGGVMDIKINYLSNEIKDKSEIDIESLVKVYFLAGELLYTLSPLLKSFNLGSIEKISSSVELLINTREDTLKKYKKI